MILHIRLRMQWRRSHTLYLYAGISSHRPLYDWVVRECEFDPAPRQIEFAKNVSDNVVTGKRYIKKLVQDGVVDGWDDPRLVSIAALRRRGFTPESLKMFVDLCGVSKARFMDYAISSYCIREDLKLKKSRMMAILDPIKLIIDNYPEGGDGVAGSREQSGK